MYTTHVIYDDKVIGRLPEGVFPPKGQKLQIATMFDGKGTYGVYEVLEYRYYLLNGELDLVEIIVVSASLDLK